jgi:hypothetical protein
MALTLSGTSGVLDNSGAFIAGTAVASTSGTSIDFTSIPSWVKRITVMVRSVSTNGSSNVIVRLGTSGGIVSSGYLGAGMITSSGASAGNFTTGFPINQGAQGAGWVIHGIMTISLIDSSTNSWVASGAFGESDAARGVYIGSSVPLSGTATTVRITTENGTDTFDAGSINILYE